MIKLTREQTAEAIRHPNGIEKTFTIVDVDLMRQVQDALTRTDHAAIQAGINDIEAGGMRPAAEAHRYGREELISRHQ